MTILQFLEGLSDRQAAHAVRSRIDGKYLLGLELTDAGFDWSVLSEFRARLIAGHAEMRMFETLLSLCRERGWLKARGRQRRDSTHVLSTARALNRLELVVETVRMACRTLESESTGCSMLIASVRTFALESCINACITASRTRSSAATYG